MKYLMSLLLVAMLGIGGITMVGCGGEEEKPVTDTIQDAAEDAADAAEDAAEEAGDAAEELKDDAEDAHGY